ncbi:phosphatidylglycerophosphatase A family protein [Pseudodesulfovibrio piezophilus]|uniref:Phosphatidylglycerophosphatase A n=1 Tax=Pseudodesulfovibrio piezophilus (strain DSM 21447 / JCM 15486 / C1TLV30) TaxID=1322246 RepID=M1WUJ8_PSEP2|nr:phosphatidylglycerophosphatase A [Pseudodesulfovibrio piezophilus]CCH47463.1 Phosphatidylglycerophosphatase A [Pseudodesulfovibrio piezophilus C1TLV30]
MIQHPRLDRFATSLATLGPVGHFPKAPGTWGSLAAILTAPWLFLPFSFPQRLLILLVILCVGIWACSRAEKVYAEKDPGCVIIDELFGQWLAILFCSTTNWQLAVAFCLFRGFDIFKPWPVKWTENTFPGGMGVMLDDGVAGLYALVFLSLITLLF